MYAGYAAAANELADEIAAALFSRQIDRWRGAFFAAEDVSEILRGAQMGAFCRR